MTEKEFRARVRENFTVPFSTVKRKGRLKERRKAYHAGEWLQGCFVEVGGRHMFRTEDFLLSPAHFDRLKFSASVNGGMSWDDLDELLNSFFDPDLYEHHHMLP